MKSNKLYLTCFMACFAIFATAKTTLSIGDCDLTSAQPKFGIYIESTNPNEDRIKALQFSILLPDGISITKKNSITIDGRFNDEDNDDSWMKQITPSYMLVYSNVGTDTYLPVSDQKQLLATVSVSIDLSNYKGGKICITGLSGGYTDPSTMIMHPVQELVGLDYYDNYEAGTIGAGGLSTFSCPAGVQISGATAYYGTISDESFVMTAFAENKVPAGTGAVLKGNAGNSYTISSVEVSALSETNDLIASVNRTEVAASSTYVIATGNDGTGFYLYTGTAIPAGKAYLDVPTGHSGAPLRVISNATGIEELESNNNAVEAYSLFGNKTENSNGQVIIENGKKIIRH